MKKSIKPIAALLLCAAILLTTTSPYYADGEPDGEVYRGDTIYVKQTQGGSETVNGSNDSSTDSSSGTSTHRSSNQTRKSAETKAAEEALGQIKSIFKSCIASNMKAGWSGFGNNSINSLDIFSLGLETINAEDINMIRNNLNTIDGYLDEGLISASFENNDIADAYIEDDQSVGQLTPALLEEAKKKIASIENIKLTGENTQTLHFGEAAKRIEINVADSVVSAMAGFLNVVSQDILIKLSEQEAAAAKGQGYDSGIGLTLENIWPSGYFDYSLFGAPISFPDAITKHSTNNVIWGIRQDLIKGGLRDSASYLDRFKSLLRYADANYMSDDMEVAVLMDCHITKVENMSVNARKEDSNIRYWQAYERDTGQPYGNMAMTTDPKRDYAWKAGDPGVYILKEYIPVTYTTDFKVYYERTNYIIDPETKYILYFNNSKIGPAYVSLGKTQVKTTEPTGLEYVVRVNEYGQVEGASGTQRVK